MHDIFEENAGVIHDKTHSLGKYVSVLEAKLWYNNNFLGG